MRPLNCKATTPLHACVRVCMKGEYYVTRVCLKGEYYVARVCMKGEYYVARVCMKGEYYVTRVCLKGEYYVTRVCMNGEYYVARVCKTTTMLRACVCFCVLFFYLRLDRPSTHKRMRLKARAGSCVNGCSTRERVVGACLPLRHVSIWQLDKLCL